MENSRDKTRGFAVKFAALTFLISFTLLLAGGISQPALAADDVQKVDVPEIMSLLDGIEMVDGKATVVVGDSFGIRQSDIRSVPAMSNIVKYACYLEEEGTETRTQFRGGGKQPDYSDYYAWCTFSKGHIGKTYRVIIAGEGVEYIGDYFEVLSVRDRGTFTINLSSKSTATFRVKNPNYDFTAFFFSIDLFDRTGKTKIQYDEEKEIVYFDLDADGNKDVKMSVTGTEENPYFVFKRLVSRSMTGSLSMPIGEEENGVIAKMWLNPEDPIIYYGTLYFKFPGPQTIKASNVNAIANKTYTGKAIKPVPVIKIDGQKLVKGRDFTVKYLGGKNVGEATITITGKRIFKGTVKKTFKVVPKGTTISKVTAAKKTFTVKWKKQAAKMSTSRIAGYQIRYATKSSMASAKKVLVKGYAKKSKKITGLKSGKKYYVQVRTYKTVKGVKYYSKWSTKKAVKVN